MVVLLAHPILAQQSSNSAAPPNQSSKIPEGEAHFTDEQLKNYYLVYKNADVQYLRTLFDAYLQGKATNAEESKWLDKWNKDYYKSKLVVLSRNRNTFGGTLITIIFQDRPDKVFGAWVYPEGADRALTLRRVAPNPELNDEDVKRIKIRYKALLEDKVHAM